MDKVMMVFLLGWINFACASTLSDAMGAKEKALAALKRFNPASALKDYTATPKEASIKPSEGNETLSSLAMNELHHNETGNEIYQASAQPHLRINPKSSEMRYADELLKNPEEVLNGACYKEPQQCHVKQYKKTCIDSMQGSMLTCKDTLTVKLHEHETSRKRTFQGSWLLQELTFNLTACELGNLYCTSANLFTLNTPCEGINVEVSISGKSQKIIKKPTCDDPMVTVSLPRLTEPLLKIDIRLKEFKTEDSWSHMACQKIASKLQHAHCTLVEGAHCLEPNATKVISGVKIKRPCWGMGFNYACSELASTTCTPLIHQGCSQVASVCEASKDQQCLRFRETFKCTDVMCLPAKTVCQADFGCTDGRCDVSENLPSNDVHEGISRLGALAGVAAEVSELQINEATPAIFAGKAEECTKFPIGFRDCCTDAGWGDWVKHCPKELQALKRARKEGRVASLGSYKKSSLGSRHHSFCVFPTKLAAILQLEGRFAQLKIPFGSAKKPDCRGMTAEELERIDFALLNLSPLTEELMNRIKLPSNAHQQEINETEILRLNEEGRAHA